MKLFETFKEYIQLNEGVYDKGIFKAIFTAGGPASGKSFIVGKTLEGHGLKTVNSDDFFEYLLEKQGLSKDLDSMTPEDYEKAMEIRKRAKNLTDKQFSLYLDGRLGLVIDGTGRDFDKIKKTSDALKDLGYDTSMVFVNTSLDVALKRNTERERSVSSEIVKQYWSDAQENIGKFQNYFGLENFIVIDNSETITQSNKDEIEAIFTKVFKEIKKILSKNINNPIAKLWISNELKNKKR